jgi:hypothetical protein
MLRLDPAHPPLWRSATCLQFGLGDVARLDEPQPWEERLIRRLERGLTDGDIAGLLRAEGVPADAADAFFAELQPVLRRVNDPPRIVLDDGGDFPDVVVRAIAESMSRTGVEVRRGRDVGADDGATVVVLAAHVVAPHRVATLMSADTRHLPLVLDGAGAVVGPVVEPGRTACLACQSLHARDADPAWPALVSQLLGRTWHVDIPLAIEAARAAAQLALNEIESAGSHSVRLRTDSLHRSWQTHRPHEECRCRSLAGTATEPVRRVPAHPAPNSPRAFARPA